MPDARTHEPVGGKPTRRRVEIRLTEWEQAFLRDQSARLNMTMSQYILKRSVYDVQRSGAGGGDSSVPLMETWGAVWDELRRASTTLSDLRDQAAYLARDTRSAMAHGLSVRLMDMCDVVERDMVSALASLGKGPRRFKEEKVVALPWLKCARTVFRRTRNTAEPSRKSRPRRGRCR